MSAHPERTRVSQRLFEPEEVATVIDLFAPVRLALQHARAPSPRPPVWRWREWKVPALVTVAILSLGVAGAALQARAVVAPAAPTPPPPPRSAPAPAPQPAAIVAREEVAEDEEPAPSMIVHPRRRPPSDLEMLAALNRRALSEYERSRPGAALRLLSQAVRLCQRPALAWNPLCADSHVNLGRVLGGAYRQTGLAARHFRIADAIRPGRATRAPAGARTLRGGLTSGERLDSGAR